MIDTLIVEKCTAAARLFDISVETLLVFAAIESNFDPAAHNASSGAAGLFQYVRSTAAEENIDPLNVNEACSATAKRISRDVDWLLANDYPSDITSLYLIHQQGKKGFGEIMETLLRDDPLKSVRLRNMLNNVPRSEARKIDDPDLDFKDKARMFIDWWERRLTRALTTVQDHLKHG